ncbi:MAG: cytochrome c peroxidase [Planctomycetota bacterium]
MIKARLKLCFVVGAWLAGTFPLYAQLQPPAAPPENPTTPEKVILGKFLFWEEQLSSDNSVACGTCHIPSHGGTDPRTQQPESRHPGPDGIFQTSDDAAGSIGVNAQDCNGTPLDDGTFFPERQVTGRRAPTFIGMSDLNTAIAGLFWDGRAEDQFFDPETGVLVIPSGGAFESQAVGPILSDVEMGCVGRTWEDVRQKLQQSVPMALATNLPPDMQAVVDQVPSPSYPDLFQAAFGTPDITARRIGFAIAAYERTLVPNQTPFDAFLAGDLFALTPNQLEGLDVFNDRCQVCHDRNLLSDQDFHNIGVSDENLDIGREAHTLLPSDRGKFKTPPLRNVALRAPYFHDGGKADLIEVLNFYNAGGDFANANIATELPGFVTTPMTNTEILKVIDFLENALTDQRVADELHPFDRPQLQTFFRRGDSNRDGAVDVADAVHVLDYLFVGTVLVLPCGDATDANDDGLVDIADPVVIVSRLFDNQPPLPTPSDTSIGPDPTPDALGCRP